MQSIHSILEAVLEAYDNILMWAACCMAFFGVLRFSEFMIPKQSAYDPLVHFSLQDVTLNNIKNPSMGKSRNQKQTPSVKVIHIKHPCYTES